MPSTIPAAKAALVALWDAAVTAAVIVGPVVGVGEDTAVIVGYQDASNPAAVDGSRAREDYGSGRLHELYLINCAVAVNYGSIGIADGETTVFVLWDALTATLEVNPTLGGVVMKAGITDRFQLVPSQGADGLTLFLVFGVAVDAFTT